MKARRRARRSASGTRTEPVVHVDESLTVNPSRDAALVRSRLLLAGFLPVLWVVMVYLGRVLGISWDESIAYFDATRGVAKVLTESTSLLASGQPGKAWLHLTTDPIWLFHPELPALQRLVHGTVASLLGGILSEPVLFRAGSSLLWILMLFLVHRLASEAFGEAAGWAALLSTVAMPRLFGHGLVATAESSLLFAWFAAFWTYRRCFDGRLPEAAFGLAMGVAFLAKFQTLGLLAALSVWGFLWNPRRAVRLFLWGFLGGLVVFIAAQPLYWTKTYERLGTYLQFNLHHFPIRSYFLGKYLPPHGPWYYSPVILAVTMPVPILLLALLGSLRILVLRRSDMLLFLWIAWVPMLLMMIPTAPTYDLERLFIQAFPMWGILAAAGVAGLWKKWPNLQKPLLAFLALLAIAQPITSHPHYLSTYNMLVGGPAGAERRGFESTYMLDAITPATLEALNREVPPGGKVRIEGMVGDALRYRQTYGTLRKDIVFVTEPVPVSHRLIYNRQGFIDPESYRLAHPVFEVTFRGASLVKLVRAGD